NPALAEDLKGHSARLFAAEVRPTPVDNDAVEQARSTIRHATLAALMYGEMKLDHAGDTQGALRLDNAAGVGLNQALARRGGRSWSTPMPALYTKATFVSVTGLGIKELALQFAREGWVVGESTASAIVRTPQLETQVLDLYERDYIAAWDQVTEHFAPIHDLVAGAPGQAKIDLVLDKIAEVAKGVSGCGGGLGEKSAEECMKKDPTAVKALSQEAKTLPPAVGTLVDSLATAVDRAGVHEYKRDLIERYQQDVLQDCETVVGSRYPFNPASKEDVPIADFGHVFGYGGLFDKFFKEHLADSTDTRTRPWRWKLSESGAVPGPEGMLYRFEVVEAIRKVYFRSGTDTPEFRFSVAPATLDSEATRVELQVDGQSVEYRHGPIRATPVRWPGPNNGTAGIRPSDRAGGHP